MLLVVAFLFFLGSLIGWIIELIYRRVVSKNWINPGFLTGPYLPIYGIGLASLFLIASVDMSSIQNEILRNISAVLLMGVMMTAIEYVGGIVFIKGMKIKLWDYSKRWGNVQGIICPFFSIIWTIAGAIYYFLIHKHILNTIAWFENNLAFSFVVGFFFGILVVDFCNTLHVVSKLKEFANENKMYVRFEEIKLYIKESQEKAKEKANFVFPFKTSNRNIKEILAEYKEKLKEHKFER
jgi:uncharacterized membrane protein